MNSPKISAGWFSSVQWRSVGDGGGHRGAGRRKGSVLFEDTRASVSEDPRNLATVLATLRKFEIM